MDEPTLTAPTLTAEELGTDPVAAYARWVDEARDAEVVDPDAAVVATATADGVPSARAVLIRVFDADGIIFFTNWHSRKGHELAANPHVAVTSVWTPLHRQVRLEGTATRATEAESDAYWEQRPHGSRVAALASQQSRRIERDELLARWQRVALDHPEGTEVPRPDHWAGVRVRPTRIEFWAGRRWRLHDRIVFEQDGDGWSTMRLAP